MISLDDSYIVDICCISAMSQVFWRPDMDSDAWGFELCMVM